MKKIVSFLLIAVLVISNLSIMSNVQAADTPIISGNSMKNAKQISSDVPYTTTIGANNEQWFKITTGEVDAFYTFNFKNYSVNKSTYMYIKTGSDNTLSENYANKNDESVAHYKLEKNNTYYILFKSKGDGNIGFSVTDTPDIEGDTSETAKTLQEKITYYQSCDGDGDIDYYKVVPNYTGKYLIKTITGNSLYIEQWIFTQYEQELSYNSTYSWGNRIETFNRYLELEKGETYYLKIKEHIGKEGQYSINISPAVTAIDINKEQIKIYAGTKLKLNTTISPLYAGNKNVIWKIESDYWYGDYANIDSNGVIKAKTPGRVTVKCYSDENDDYFDACTVIIKPSKNKIRKLKRVSKRYINVKFSKKENVDGYVVYMSKKKKGKYKKIGDLSSYSNDFTTNKLKKNRRYYFKVRSYIMIDDVRYYSKYSEIKSIKTK